MYMAGATSKGSDQTAIMCSLIMQSYRSLCSSLLPITVKILKIGTPEIITIIVLQLEQLDFTMQYCVQKMQTE